MRTCDLVSGTGRMAQALSALTERWAEIKPQWRDAKCQQFEDKYLHELPGLLRQLMNAASQLAESVEKAETDCDDRQEIL